MSDPIRNDDLVLFIRALDAAVRETIEREQSTEIEDMFDQLLIASHRHGEVVLGGTIIRVRELFRAGAIATAFDALQAASARLFHPMPLQPIGERCEIDPNGSVSIIGAHPYDCCAWIYVRGSVPVMAKTSGGPFRGDYQ